MNDNRSAFTTVAGGVELVYYSVIVYILTVFWMFLGPFVLSRATVPLYLIGMSLGFLVAGVLDITGRLKCMSIPESVGGGAKAMIALSALLCFIGIVISVWQLGIVFMDFPLMPLIVLQLQQPIAILSFVLFVLFLRSVAVHIQRPDLSSRAITVLVLMGALFVAAFGMRFLMSTGDKQQAGLIALGVIALAIVALVMYLLLLSRSAAGIRHFAVRRDVPTML